MARLRVLTLDEDAERVCENLAEAIFPRHMDFAQREDVLNALRHFMRQAKRGNWA
jgi:hypothetical protein